LYKNQLGKALIQDHYIWQLYYFKDCDKVFAVSQMKPDVLQKTLMQEAREKERE
jgi:hypothetical protein